jgi:hypothetical protein
MSRMPVSPRKRRGERGQSMVETAITMPIMVALIAGMIMAGFYAFRSASANWGVFISGVGAGAFDAPMTGRAKGSVPWGDIRSSLNAGPDGERAVSSMISIEYARDFVFGIRLVEAERAKTNFRLWRFYPGPPEGDTQ